MTRRTLNLAAGLLLGLALVVANTAAARTLSMSGQWFQNRGPLVDIPNNGGPTVCFPGNFGDVKDGCVNNL
ncbi:MAG: hypothetical protein ABGY29_07875, partial [bacterium]